MSITAQPPPPSATAPSESLWTSAPPPSELDTFLDSTAVPPSAAESPLAWALSAAAKWLAFFRGLTLAAGSALSGAVAVGGLALLLFLALTASLAPASDTFSRPLSLDFSDPNLAAQAVFLPEAQLSDGLPPGRQQQDARFLAPQQAVDVWAELLVPCSGCGQGPGLAQVVAQLTSLDGRVAAKASHVVSLRCDWWGMRSMAQAPLRWLGLSADLRRVRVPLFSNYKEKREVPFMVANVAIKTRNPMCAPEVMSASVKVQLRLGLLRRIVYLLRPGRLALPLLGVAGAAAVMGGSGVALVCLALLIFLGFGGRGGGEAGGADEVGSVAADDEVEVGSVSGVSEASSSMLHELSTEEGEPPSPTQALAAGGGGSRSRRAAAMERWQDSLPHGGSAGGASGIRSMATAAAGVGGGAGRAKAGAAGRPADSAISAEFAGGRLAGLLRRRAGGAAPASSS